MNARRSPLARPKAALRFPFAALLVSVGATIAAFTGCGLNTSGLPHVGGGGGSGPAVPCETEADCATTNPCKIGKCGSDKTCDYATNVPDGPAPESAQTQYDCKKVVCTAGKKTTEDDPSDVEDDGQECTEDTCGSDGKAHHTPKIPGTACTLAGGNPGKCDDYGVCQPPCLTAADCPSAGPCTTIECNTAAGQCVTIPLPDGTPTPGVADVKGDCHTHICVSGADTDVEDPTDIPVSGNDCVTDVCTNGVPSNPPVAIHTHCNSWNGGAGRCDGAGTCVQCTQADDCAAIEVTDDCNMPGCDASGLCFQDHQPAGTPTGATWPQVSGDCQHKECDGNGAPRDVFDATDPSSDGNVCTTDACQAGPPPTTTNTNVTDGTACGNGLSCNGGVCHGCTQDSQCTPASCKDTVTLTNAQTCDSAGNCVSHGTTACGPYFCNAATNACNTSCATDADCSNANDYCNAAKACVPKLTQGTACTATNQCANGSCVDGVCCASACDSLCEACINAKTGQPNGTCAPIKIGTDPDNECADGGATNCGTNGLCNGAGACQLYPSGTACGTSCSSGMIANKTCNGTGTCVTGTGSACPNNLKCQDANVCYASCGTGGQADSNKCINTTTYSCEASSGLCKLVPGQTCTANSACTGGHCGTTGAGHCCSTTCTTGGTCGAVDCNTSGACQYPASGTDCGTGCSAGQLTPKTCNGTGTCTTGTTTACTGGVTCASATACYPNCGGTDAHCQSSTTYCTGATGTCAAKHATGSCPSGGHECTSGICGSNSNCCSAACSTDAICGSSACDATSGACNYPPSGTDCGTSCSAGKLTPKTCNTSGACVTGTTAGCPGGVTCADATSCNANCGGLDTHCQDQTGTYCTGATGTCAAKHTTGACPSGGHECTSGNCATNGNCCAATTCAAGDTGCALTGCDVTSGACTYPTGNVCVAASCPSTGSTFTAAKTCTSTGTCTNGGASNSCGGDLMCAASGTACLTSCNGDPDCISADYCDGANPGACHTKIATGSAACTSNHMCVSGNCSVINNTCCKPAVTCINAGTTCGTTGCNASGDCAYPTSTTSCGTPSCTGYTLTTGHCDGTGSCATSSGNCPGNFVCSSTTTCKTACGGNNPGGDGNCAFGYYCDGVGAGACQPQLDAGGSCGRGGECLSGVCTGNVCQ